MLSGILRAVRPLSAPGCCDRATHFNGIHSQPPGQVSHISDVERLVADSSNDRGGCAQRSNATLHRVEVEPREHTPHHELEHRLLALDELANRGITTLESKVARVEPLWGDSDERLGCEALLLAERAARCFLPCLIGVEGEHDLAEPAGIRVVEVP